MHDPSPPLSAASSTWTPTWRSDSYASLGSAFVTRLQPTPLPDPRLLAHSPDLAAQLGIPAAWWASDDAAQVLTGNRLLPGSQPFASVYSGHQFGVWAGQLGDGRAIGLGEVPDVHMADLGWELQLKGAGRTPYSRGGDGRAVLRSSIREYLCSEAMHALGIPTTRALSLTASPGTVYREEAETAAVVCRAAPSFIRFGHFEHFAARDQLHELRQLADYVIDRYYPACRNAEGAPGAPYAALLRAVSERTAEMLAHWQAVGFCHGVMNTDNMSILGLTIDYGPFQFLDTFDPGHICNHSDHQGRYAFRQQPQVAYWNLFCLGQALHPLIGDEDSTVAAIEAYRPHFSCHFAALMRRKLGLPSLPNAASATEAQDPATPVIGQLLQLLASQQVDYTIFWRRLSAAAASGHYQAVSELFLDRAAWQTWLLSYQELFTLPQSAPDADLMHKANPGFVLRNHLGEIAIRAAQAGDGKVLQQLQTVLAAPYAEHPAPNDWAGFPPDWATSISISCSS